MKKVLLATLLAISPMMVMAQELPPAPVVVPETFNSFSGLLTFVQNLLNWFFIAIIVMAVFYLLYVGLRYILSGGKKETVQGIGTAFGYIIVGLIVAIIAKGLIYAVCYLFSPGGCKV